MQISEQIQHLPEQHLLALARNEAAIPEAREAAVRFLVERGHASARHPDIAVLVGRFTPSEFVPEVAPAPIAEVSAPSASVVTSSLFQDESESGAKDFVATDTQVIPSELDPA